MLQLTRILAAAAALAGCGTAPPPSPTPCDREGYGSQACQIYQYSRAGF